MEASSPDLLSALSEFAQGLLAPLLAVGISVVYFLASPRSEPLGRRVLSSMHGVAIALLYILALSVHWAGQAEPRYGAVFIASLAIPVACIGTSLLLFRGRRVIHALQLPNLLCLAWTGFVGVMAVTGDWL